MTGLDWVVLFATIAAIVLYGVLASRRTTTVSEYLRGGRELGWWTVGLSVMATQASAITFLSTPGQAFEDGMGFVQFYFGLPLAMIVVAAVFVPIFYRLDVYTAYEYLERRFDVRMRLIGAALFLVSRGLAAGITIYAPSIILSSILGWPLDVLNVAIGLLVIVYTVSGGTVAVSRTQKQQMIVIMAGMFLAAGILIYKLPTGVDLDGATAVAGALGRMEIIDLDLELDSRYNLWSGLAGGFFLALSYFGTDQSQVQRYLAGRSVVEGRLGLLFNGFVKIPMQAFILYVGVLLFVYHLFFRGPVFFNEALWEETDAPAEKQAIEERYEAAFEARRAAALAFLEARATGDGLLPARVALVTSSQEVDEARAEAKALVLRRGPRPETEDADYVFVRFVLHALPSGVVGLLIAVILSAAMSSTASELNALGTTTMVDFWRRLRGPPPSERVGLLLSKGFTALWGLVALAFATFASLFDNLIEAVNVLGSIFYGTVLGIFVVAFFFRWIGARAVFVGALAGQATVLFLFASSDLGFLWYNVVGCIVVASVSAVAQPILGDAPRAA